MEHIFILLLLFHQTLTKTTLKLNDTFECLFLSFLFLIKCLQSLFSCLLKLYREYNTNNDYSNDLGLHDTDINIKYYASFFAYTKKHIYGMFRKKKKSETKNFFFIKFKLVHRSTTIFLQKEILIFLLIIAAHNNCLVYFVSLCK